MKNKTMMRLLALAAAMSLCVALTACNRETTTVDDEDDSVATSDMLSTTRGGAITMPEGFTVTDGSNVLNTMLVDDVLAGQLTLVSYRTTNYFTTTGTATLTINCNLTLSDGSPVTTTYLDATVALWKQGDGVTEYVETLHFPADGTTQTYTFTNLEPNADYRLAFTYSTVARYRLNGQFNVTGIGELLEGEELPEGQSA